LVRFTPPTRSLRFAVLVAVLSAFLGCQAEPPGPPLAASSPAGESAAQPASAPATAKTPKLPDGDDAEAAADVIIQNTYDRHDKETYRMDEKAPVGHVRGACRFADCPSFRHSPPKLADVPVDLSKPGAILGPKPGEVTTTRG
jgi:hypothetical protein